MTIFDLRFGEGFGARPLPLLRRAARAARLPLRARSTRAGRAGRCSLPAALVAVGFGVDALPAYGFFHVDSPVAALDDWLQQNSGSLTSARAFLVLATVALVALFVLASSLLPRRPLALALAALTLVVLPLETAYDVRQALRPPGHLGPLAHAPAGRRLRLGRRHGRAPRRT